MIRLASRLKALYIALGDDSRQGCRVGLIEQGNSSCEVSASARAFVKAESHYSGKGGGRTRWEGSKGVCCVCGDPSQEQTSFRLPVVKNFYIFFGM